MQITKDELARELAEMVRKENENGRIIDRVFFDNLPFHRKLHFKFEAEKFIRALNNIRRRKKSNETSTPNIPTI